MFQIFWFGSGFFSPCLLIIVLMGETLMSGHIGEDRRGDIPWRWS